MVHGACSQFQGTLAFHVTPESSGNRDLEIPSRHPRICVPATADGTTAAPLGAAVPPPVVPAAVSAAWPKTSFEGFRVQQMGGNGSL